MSNFTHLHLHTCYSLSSGTIRIDDLINIAKKNKLKSLALTDHLNIFGAVKFYNKCIEAKIKPIKYPIVAPVKYNKPTPFSGVPEKTGKPMIPSNR